MVCNSTSAVAHELTYATTSNINIQLQQFNLQHD